MIRINVICRHKRLRLKSEHLALILILPDYDTGNKTGGGILYEHRRNVIL
jgi:hypothetical protein